MSTVHKEISGNLSFGQVVTRDYIRFQPQVTTWPRLKFSPFKKKRFLPSTQCTVVDLTQIMTFAHTTSLGQTIREWYSFPSTRGGIDFHPTTQARKVMSHSNPYILVSRLQSLSSELVNVICTYAYLLPTFK